MGDSELTIAGLLGHSVSGVTARYAHVPDAALLAAADRSPTASPAPLTDFLLRERLLRINGLQACLLRTIWFVMVLPSVGCEPTSNELHGLYDERLGALRRQ
jgi:hypothetical protein